MLGTALGLSLLLALTAGTTSEPFRGAGIVGFPDGCRDIERLDLSWYYTWDHGLQCTVPGVDFVPMVWSDWCPDDSDCAIVPQRLVARGEETVLGFNEPDWHEQADLTVERALELWHYLDDTPLRLGSPAVTSGPRGTAWLEEFLTGAEERGLRVDFVAAHWFGDCSTTDHLVDYLDGLAEHGHPIWLTEFACEGQDVEVNERFVREFARRVPGLPYLERVAWFTNRPYPGYVESALVGEDDRLTPVGRAYLDLPKHREVSRRLLRS